MAASAGKIVEHIETSAQYVNRRLQYASRLLLGRNDDVPEQSTITWQDIERSAAIWTSVIPSDSSVRADVVDRLEQTLGPIPTSAANSRAAFGLPAAEADSSTRSTLKDNIVADIVSHLEWRFVRRGDMLLHRGTPSRGLWLLLDGLVDIEVPDIDGDAIDDVVAKLYPGEFIGETALLTGEPHSASVIARRDSDFAFLSADAFERLVAVYPELMRRIALQAVRRLRAVYQPRPANLQTRVFMVVDATGGIERAVKTLAEALERSGRTLVLAPDKVDAIASERSGEDLESFVGGYEFLQWFNQEKAAYDTILCMGSADFPNWTRRMIEQASRVLVLAQASGSRDVGAQERLLYGMDKPHLAPPIDLILLHENRQVQPSGSVRWLEGRPVTQHIHVAPHHSPDIDRLLRHLAGTAVGIVFGGGGMRGAAHAGVIQAMAELGIYADAAGGTSAGAVVAAQYGLEWSVERIMAETKEKLLQRSTLFQFTFPYAAITSAQALNASYEAMFGDVAIEDLWIPVFTIASNLTQARMEVIDTGSLHLAVRASTSLAGIHPPTVAPNNDLLLDGGGFNNTPADVMRRKIGSGHVIAVDMGFTKRNFPTFNYGYYLNGFSWLLNRINPVRRKKITAPFLVDTLLRSNALWSIQKTREQVAYADLILRPPVSEFGLFDIDSADAIFERGYEYAKPVLVEWAATHR